MIKVILIIIVLLIVIMLSLSYIQLFLTDLAYAPFVGHQFLITRHYDAMLREYYSDYMQLPPRAKQVNKHHVIGIKL